MPKRYDSVVVLHDGLNQDVYLKAFTGDGETIWCEVIDEKGPYLHIKATLADPPEAEGEVFIPHQFVKLIVKNVPEEKLVGFRAALKD